MHADPSPAGGLPPAGSGAGATWAARPGRATGLLQAALHGRGRYALACELGLVALILALSLVLRVYRLPDAPPGLQHDEAFNAQDAEQVLQGAHPVFFAANYGREAFFIYLMAGSIALLGHNAVAIRLPGVVCGLAGEVLLYLLLRRLYGRRAALLALALTATSFWHLFDSRLGLRAISLPLLLTLSLYLLWRGLSEERRLWWLLSGAAMGLTLYTYLSARIAPLVPLLFFAYLGLVDRPRLRRQWPALLLWAGAALAVFAPLGLYMLRNPAVVNARIQALSYTLEALQRGNPWPVLKSTVATLGMFTFTGDPEWRYSLPGLPVFAPLTGLFFYLGLYACLRRLRQPRNGLLLIWLVVMLAPSALSDSAPSSLRAIGALPPALALPAIGLVSALDYLRERRPAWPLRLSPAGARTSEPRATGRVEGRGFGSTAVAAPGAAEYALYALIVLLIVGGGVRTAHAYFTVWAQAPEPRRAYEADMAETAHYLSALPAGSHVCLSTDFAFDLDRYVLRWQLARQQDIKWFDGRQAFVLPAVPADGKDVTFIFTASAPLDPYVAGRYFAGLDPVYQPRDRQGAPIITVYRVSSEQLQRLHDLPLPHSLQARLGDDMDLLGYDLPETVRQGDALQAFVYWRPVQRFARDYGDAPKFFVHLRDGADLFWAQDDRIGFPAWDWAPGDLALNWFELPTLADFPLQPYWVRLGITASGRKLPVQDGQGQALGDELRLERPVQVLATAAPAVDALPIGVRTDRAFGGEIALRGYTLPESARPGNQVTVALFWQALAQPQGDYAARLRLIDAGGRVRAEQTDPLWPGVYPSSRWVAGGYVRSYHTLTLPAELDSGPLTLEVVVADARGQPLSGEPALATLQVEGRRRLWEAPGEMQHPLRAELGSEIALLGYSLSSQSVPRGGVLHLTLYWQARDRIETGYTVFTHVLAPGNVMCGQQDSVPGGGEAPTTGWLPNEVIVDLYNIPIGPEAPLGRQIIEVGMYDPATGERLPTLVAGEPDPDRRVILGEVEVRAR